MKKIRIIILLITTCFLLKVWAKTSQQYELPPIVITAYTVTPKDIPLVINSFGHLSSNLFSQYSSETAGVITNIYFNAGDNVKKNQALYQLNDSIPLSSVMQAEAQLNLAQLDKNRYETLQKQKVISQQELDKAENAYQQAVANLALARAALNQTKINAPFDGIIGSSNVNLGEYVAPGKILVTITNNKELELDYKVPDKYLNLLKLNQEVLFTVESDPARSFRGVVDYVAPFIDKTTHSVAVRAHVDNKDLILAPGLAAKISQQLKIKNNAIAIPGLALNADIEGYYVYKVRNGTAQAVRVKTGQYLLNEVEILSGLEIGDVIAVEGTNRLSNGSKVKIVSLNK